MKNNKIIYIICVLIIIIGLIVAKTLGINYSIEYDFEKNIDKNELKELATEVLGKDIKIYGIERFNDAFTIKTKDITDEQQENLKTKLNEKYAITFTDDNIKIIDIPKVTGIDLIKQYIKPVIISAILVCIYLSIRYKKIGNIKIAFLTILKSMLITGAYFSLVIITRLPIVNIYTIPIGILIALISLIVICCKNENKIEKVIKENN